MSNQPNGHGPSTDGRPDDHQNGEQNGHPSSPTASDSTVAEKVIPAVHTRPTGLKHAGTTLEDKRTVDLDDYFVRPLGKD